MEKIVTLKNGMVNVREIIVTDMLDFFDNDAGLKLLAGVMAGLPANMYKIIFRCVDLDEAALKALGMADYQKIEEAFKEVNADFLASLPGRIKTLTGSGEQLEKLLGLSIRKFAGSSEKAT